MADPLAQSGVTRKPRGRGKLLIVTASKAFPAGPG
jgi:hypothetical protein